MIIQSDVQGQGEVAAGVLDDDVGVPAIVIGLDIGQVVECRARRPGRWLPVPCLPGAENSPGNPGNSLRLPPLPTYVDRVGRVSPNPLLVGITKVPIIALKVWRTLRVIADPVGIICVVPGSVCNNRVILVLGSGVVVISDLSAGWCAQRVPLFPDEKVGACADIICDLACQTTGVIPRRAAWIYHLHNPISTGSTDESPIPLAGKIAVAIKLSPTGFHQPDSLQDDARDRIGGGHGHIGGVRANASAYLIVSRASAAQAIGCRIVKSRAHRDAIWLLATPGCLVTTGRTRSGTLSTGWLSRSCKNEEQA